jgi:AcrR family transcriptional regulator
MISRQDGGRANQKLRTRRAIIEAAAALMRENRAPTVAEAAERALVSRATAYRYFPTQQSLLIEVQADAAQPSPGDVLAEAGDDAAERIETASRAISRMILADEALYRNQMRISQELWFGREAGTPVREGRRLAWIDQALAPAATRLPAGTLAALRNALAAVIGVEPVVSLRDVCGLSPQATEDTLAWTARTIVEAVTGRQVASNAAGAQDPAGGRTRHQHQDTEDQ